MENFHPTLPGEFNNPCKFFFLCFLCFLCFLRFLLLIHFPFKVEGGHEDLMIRPLKVSPGPWTSPWNTPPLNLLISQFPIPL